MKLLRIELSNLNSLYGPHEIDLEKQLGSAPLFLIVGPTGSGKSTLMDAVSLALFGQTPRLPVPKSDVDSESDSRNVISRGAGVAHARVELGKIEGGKRVRYAATWMCQRARKAPDGRLQAPVRTLERLEGGAWVTLVSDHREKFYGEAFAKFLEGMTVEDFKRSMLLAQGEFAAFLKAHESERASILERLTDTGMYKALGARARERWHEAKRQLELAEQAVGGVALLTADEESALRGEAADLNSSAAQTKEAAGVVAACLGWLEHSGKLKNAAENAASQEAEAQRQLEEARPQLARLEAHARCTEAILPLAERDRLAGELADLRDQAPMLDEVLQSLCAQAAEAEEVLKSSTQARDLARHALEETSTDIALARTQRAELATAVREREAADAVLLNKRAEAEAAETQLGEYATARTAAAVRLQKAGVAIQRHENGRPLVEALTGLRERVQQVEERKKESSARAERINTARFECDALTATLGSFNARVDDLARRLPPLETTVAEAKTKLNAALAGSPDVATRRKALRIESERLTAQTVALTSFSSEAKARTREMADLDVLMQQFAERERLRLETQQKGAATYARLESLQSERERFTAEFDDLQWFRSVARERSRLKDDSECPLCGSIDHPALHDGRFQERDGRLQTRCDFLAKELEANQAALDQVQRELLTAEKAVAALDAEMAQLQSREMELRESISAHGAQIAAIASTAGWNDVSQEGLAIIAARIRQAEADNSKAQAGLDDAERIEQTAGRALSVAQTEMEREKASASEMKARLDEKMRARASLEAEHAEANRRDETGMRELQQSLEALGLGSADPQLALTEATRRVGALHQAEAELSAAKEAALIAEAAHGESSTRHSLAASAQDEAARTVATRVKAVTEIEARCAQILSGRDPDLVEKGLQEALVTADAAFEKSRTKVVTLEQDKASARTRIEEQCKRSEAISTELAEAQAQVESIARRLGMGDAEALQRVLLPDDEVRRLTSERTTILQVVESARALRAARAVEIEAHNAIRPAEVDAGQAALLVRQTELVASLEGLQQRIGAIDEQLRVQEMAKQQLGEKQAALENARNSFALWDQLHLLIGQGDGDAFKRYAQTLNMAELIERANNHLERLAPRYKLTGAKSPNGESRLAFAVKDAFQADTVRPVSTLSGGETFLLSLALALGLASYRTIQMPIETLLLDEGFGTLDPDTLQVAMAALEALNAAGTQVGIISHVEALKEKIPARILIERIGNGHSTIRVEAA